MFKPNAGQMRGFRIVRDPDGILFDPFEYMGVQMGYVITYGEGVPSIHNGKEWVPIIDEAAVASFENDLQNLIVTQATKIAGAVSNPIYAELANQMGLYAAVGAAVPAAASGGPTEDTFVFEG